MQEMNLKGVAQDVVAAAVLEVVAVLEATEVGVALVVMTGVNYIIVSSFYLFSSNQCNISLMMYKLKHLYLLCGTLCEVPVL